MLAEIHQRVADELARRLRDEHLPAVAARRDPRAKMDVGAHVPLVAEMRCAGVQSHSHPQSTRCQRLIALLGTGERTLRRGEDVEEGVSLGVDLDPTVLLEGIAQRPTVLCEARRVSLCPELVQELGRAFDVGKEEGDPSRRKPAPHVLVIMRRSPWRV